MPRRVAARLGLSLLLIAGCGGDTSAESDGGSEGEAEAEGEGDAGPGSYQITFASLPPAGTLVREPFSVTVEIGDPDTGLPITPDAPLAITLEKAAGNGTLAGARTETVTASTAVFADLSYDAWDSLQIRATSAKSDPATSPAIAFDVGIAADPTDLGQVFMGAPIPPVEFTVLDGLGAPFSVSGSLEWTLVDRDTRIPHGSGSEPVSASARATVQLLPVDVIASYALEANLAGSANQAAVDLEIVGYDIVLTSIPPAGTLVNAPFGVDIEIRDPGTGLPVAPADPLMVDLDAAAGTGTLSGALSQVVSTPTASFPNLSYDTLDTLQIRATSARSLPALSSPIAFEVDIQASTADLGEIRPGAAIPPVTFTLLDGLANPYPVTGDLVWTLTDEQSGLPFTSGTEPFGGTAMATVGLSPIVAEAPYRLVGNLTGFARQASTVLEIEGYDLAFSSLPASGTLVNGPFSVDVEIQDRDTGLPTVPDAPLRVVLDLASGTGTLSGTLSQDVATATATYAGLSYDTLDSVEIRASSSQSAPVVSGPIAFEVDIQATPSNLGQILPNAPIPAVTFTLYDGLGALHPVTGSLSWTLFNQSPPPTPYASGSEAFAGTATATVNLSPIPDEASYQLVGSLDGSDNQATSDLLISNLTLENEPGPFVALKSSRVGDIYYDDVSFAVPGAFEWGLLTGSLPDGITLDPSTGELSGTPTTPTNGDFTLFARTGPTEATPIRCALAVFSPTESEWVSGQSFVAPGPYTVTTTPDTVVGFTSSFDGSTYDTDLMIYHPDLAAVSSPLPLFVFHRGKGFNHLDYDLVLTQIASHGFICVSVEDCQSFAEGAPAGCSANFNYDNVAVWDGMESGSAFQEAAILHMKARNGAGGDAFEGKVDETAVFVGGHSRGGGTTHASHVRGLDLLINGAVYFMAYDLRCFAETQPGSTTPPTYEIPDVQPRLPSLILAAEYDNDLVYPIADQLIERASGQTTSVTVYGGCHNYLGDTNPVEFPFGGQPAPYITREEQHGFVVNQVIAFLKRWGTLDLSLEGFLYGNEFAGSADVGVVARRNMTDAIWIDDFQDGNAAQNLLGGTNSLTGGSSSETSIYPQLACSAMGSLGIQQKIMTFSANSSTYSTELPGGLDVSAHRRLVFRCGQTDTDGYDWVTIRARLSDGAQSATVTLFDRTAPDTTYLPDFTGDERVYDRFVDVQVLLADFAAANPALDLSALASIDLVFEFSGVPAASQQIYLDDLRFD